MKQGINQFQHFFLKFLQFDFGPEIRNHLKLLKI